MILDAIKYVTASLLDVFKDIPRKACPNRVNEKIFGRKLVCKTVKSHTCFELFVYRLKRTRRPVPELESRGSEEVYRLTKWSLNIFLE